VDAGHALFKDLFFRSACCPVQRSGPVPWERLAINEVLTQHMSP